MSLLEVMKKGFCWIEMRTVLVVFGIVSSVGLWWDLYLIGLVFCVGFGFCFAGFVWVLGFVFFFN